MFPPIARATASKTIIRGLPSQVALARSRTTLTSTSSRTGAPDLLSTIQTTIPAPPKKLNPKLSSNIQPNYKNSPIKAPPLHQYYLHVHSTRNNTILTLVDARGNCIPDGRVSSGMLGFKNVQRSGYEAGHQCAIKLIRKMEEEAQKNKVSVPGTGVSGEYLQDGMCVELVFNGFGQGRDALTQALLTSEGDVVRRLINRLTDRTPIKIGGTRSKKARRL